MTLLTAGDLSDENDSIDPLVNNVISVNRVLLVIPVTSVNRVNKVLATDMLPRCLFQPPRLHLDLLKNIFQNPLSSLDAAAQKIENTQPQRQQRGSVSGVVATTGRGRLP